MKIENLTMIGGGMAVKKDSVLDNKSFVYTKCQYCDEWISNCGWAAEKHYQKHKRQGDGQNQIILNTELRVSTKVDEFGE